MIAELQVVPQSDEEWERWSWHHRDHHEQIIAAIKQQKSLTLNELQVEPINWDQFDTFVQNNEQMHFDMNQALGMQASDLGELDPKQPQALAQWIFAHWMEHQQVAVALEI